MRFNSHCTTRSPHDLILADPPATAIAQGQYFVQQRATSSPGKKQADLTAAEAATKRAYGSGERGVGAGAPEGFVWGKTL